MKQPRSDCIKDDLRESLQGLATAVALGAALTGNEWNVLKTWVEADFDAAAAARVHVVKRQYVTATKRKLSRVLRALARGDQKIRQPQNSRERDQYRRSWRRRLMQSMGSKLNSMILRKFKADPQAAAAWFLKRSDPRVPWEIPEGSPATIVVARLYKRSSQYPFRGRPHKSSQSRLSLGKVGLLQQPRWPFTKDDVMSWKSTMTLFFGSQKRLPRQ